MGVVSDSGKINGWMILMTQYLASLNILLMEKFKNKYRIVSARAPFHDYASDGAYFITICTKNRIPWFGAVKNGNMELSAAGRLAWTCWLEIPEHFPFVSLGAFVAMPDHVHGIIIIDKNGMGPETRHVEARHVEARHAAPLHLGCVVGGFKSAVTKTSRLQFPEFAWQTRYYDRIIRDNAAFRAITRYIESNIENYAVKYGRCRTKD